MRLIDEGFLLRVSRFDLLRFRPKTVNNTAETRTYTHVPILSNPLKVL